MPKTTQLHVDAFNALKQVADPKTGELGSAASILAQHGVKVGSVHHVISVLRALGVLECLNQGTRWDEGEWRITQDALDVGVEYEENLKTRIRRKTHAVQLEATIARAEVAVNRLEALVNSLQQGLGKAS